MLFSSGKGQLNDRENRFFYTNRTFILAGLILATAVAIFLWKPFQEAPLKTEYHSGRDSFTLAPNQIPAPPTIQSSSEHSINSAASRATTPQTAAIEAQLAEAKKLSAGREARQQRIAELNQLIAKVDQAQGIERTSADSATPSLTDARTAQISQDLDALQARTERLQKRLN